MSYVKGEIVVLKTLSRYSMQWLINGSQNLFVAEIRTYAMTG